MSSVVVKQAESLGLLRPVQSGIKHVYVLSLMADLRRAYLEEPSDDSSLLARAMVIANKKVLEVAPVEHFTLETGFRLGTERMIRNMQELLKKAANLVEGTETYFSVDPHKTLMSVLRNASKLNDLHVAWVGLSKRMELAQRNFEKYESEYRALTQDELLLSPVSTELEVYSVFPRDKSAISNAPTYLQRAFPPRLGEHRPSTVYYSAAGNQKEIAVSGRSSHSSPPNFELPSEKPKPLQRHPQRRVALPERALSKGGGIPTTVEERKDESRTASISKVGMMGANIPYKTANQFFVPTSLRDMTYQTPTPGPSLPNPLVGMASASTAPYPVMLDSISQLTGVVESQEKGRMDAAQKLTAATLRGVPEVDEQLFHTNAPRDLPPHLEGRDPTRSPKQWEKRRPWSAAGGQPAVFRARDYHQDDSPPRGNGDRAQRGLCPTESREQGREHSVQRGREGETHQEERAASGDPEDDPSSDDDGGSGGIERRSYRDPPPPRRRGSPSGDRPGREPPSPPSNPDTSDAGGGGGGGGGGGNGGNPPFPYIALGAPYEMIVPTIKPKLKVESLPEWDGEHDPAVDYFWESAGILVAIPFEEGLASICMVFTLPTEQQAEMRSHYLVYLKVIKDKYLGKQWQLLMNLEFEKQTFCQEGHEKESPQKFLGRQIKYVRLLVNTDDGGPIEVFLVMRKALIAWSTIIVLENISSTEELYERVNEHEEALMEVFERNRPDALMLHNLSSALKHLGFSQNSSAPPGKQTFRRANLTEVSAEWDQTDGDRKTEW
ncbi:hypothetical protein B0H19DRAFT_1064932 [Mycena capillaripes]|nr:hypothetical protein B0H19DRAFT_1064932 [Mycena capillaripes]